ncbi:MAG: periplasmic heavy metal sensor [Deltaproteobacteria bacterium]|nr:periplasmic heavy metal sensor [Deltaproteobacteria bacterium]MCW5805474.1 periplasmic heavy metal sensor [Deltaproteobacteria bacterium]
MRRAHRRCHGGGCGGGYSYGGWDGPWHRHHHRGRHWMLYSMLARIDATPAQERTIVAELDKVRDRVHGAKSGLGDARSDLAAALRNPSLDDAALGAVLGRVDTATGEARTAILEALRNIHAVLDDKQRSLLADLVDRGGGWRAWRHGPYR